MIPLIIGAVSTLASKKQQDQPSISDVFSKQPSQIDLTKKAKQQWPH